MVDSRKQKQNAFTLIELLVVIVVISILAAMLLSALAKGKAQAQSAQCKSNLHQLSLALNLYTSDNHKYPFFEQGDVYFLIYWDNIVLPYAGNSQTVYICPANEWAPMWTNLPGHELYYGGVEPMPNPSYGYNFAGTYSYSNAWSPPNPRFPNPALGLGGQPGFGIAVPESKIIAPHDMVAITDWTNWPAGDDHDGDDYINLLAQLLPTRHDQGVNGTFCDGHVEYRKYAAWTRKTAAARQSWNNDHQPHPETWIYDPN